MTPHESRRAGNARIDRRAVRMALDFKGWTYGDLARHAGIAKSTIGNLMTSRYTCDVKTAQKIAKAFERPTEQFFLLDLFTVHSTDAKKSVA